MKTQAARMQESIDFLIKEVAGLAVKKADKPEGGEIAYVDPCANCIPAPPLAAFTFVCGLFVASLFWWIATANDRNFRVTLLEDSNGHFTCKDERTNHTWPAADGGTYFRCDKYDEPT